MGECENKCPNMGRNSQKAASSSSPASNCEKSINQASRCSAVYRSELGAYARNIRDITAESMVGMAASQGAGGSNGVVERTLAIIKPDAWHRAKEIEEDIRSAGLTIFSKRDVVLTKDQCADFYIEHVDKPFFNDLIEYMTSGTCRVLILSGSRAISHWRQVIGPTDVEKARRENSNCIRARYGGGKTQNAVHGSDSFTSAEREIHFFFPDLEPVSVADQVRVYLAHEVNPTLTMALAELCKSQPDDPVLWLADWLKDNNPNPAGLN